MFNLIIGLYDNSCLVQILVVQIPRSSVQLRTENSLVLLEWSICRYGPAGRTLKELVEPSSVGETATSCQPLLLVTVHKPSFCVPMSICYRYRDVSP